MGTIDPITELLPQAESMTVVVAVMTGEGVAGDHLTRPPRSCSTEMTTIAG